MFVVFYSKGNTSGYVRKHDGMNDFLDDPRQASRYPTTEDARRRGLVGHHRDMGGDGFLGRVVPYDRAKREYAARSARRNHWRW